MCQSYQTKEVFLAQKAAGPLYRNFFEVRNFLVLVVEGTNVPTANRPPCTLLSRPFSGVLTAGSIV